MGMLGQEPAPTSPPAIQRDRAITLSTVPVDLFQQVVMKLETRGCLGLLLKSRYTRRRLGRIGILVWSFLGKVRFIITPDHGFPDPRELRGNERQRRAWDRDKAAYWGGKNAHEREVAP